MVKANWEHRKLQLYAFWLALVVCLSAGIIMAFLDDELRKGSILSSIGLNLIAAVIFAFIFSWLSGNLQQRILIENLRSEQHDASAAIQKSISELSAGMLDKLAGYEKRYMPTTTYPASNELIREFNEDVSASLQRTASYAFRGTSGKYVPTRLKKAPRGNLRDVKIIMLDPRSSRVLNARAAERMDQESGSRLSVEDISADIRQEILMSVVALYDCRLFCSPDIAFVQETAATRIELLDDAVYVSWYQGPESTKRRFPETLKFARGTFFCDVLAQEFHRRHNLADLKIRFNSDTSESELCDQVAVLAGRPCTLHDLQHWRSTHATFSEPFEDFLGNPRSP
ncbi:hypothetical protein [Nonomuraea sp. NPDC050643]|uniref:hypothetical protein n=1 Tax=Nonomuraea sp. NPDC050643 TaxID=3155660 RepID=UPI0033C2B1EF